MEPIAVPGDRVLALPLVIDGIAFQYRPSEINLPPEPISDYQPMLDGSIREWQRRPGFSGIANQSEHFSVSFPLEALQATDLRNIKYIRAKGGLHRLVVWSLECIVYTLQAGLTRLYLPHFKKCAAHLYSGLAVGNQHIVDTDLFRTFATLNGDDLNVTYAEGPSLVSPGAGGLVIARQPDTTGEAQDFTAMRLGDTPVAGDELELWSYFALECSLQVTQVNLSGLREDHAYTFVEL